MMLGTMKPTRRSEEWIETIESNRKRYMALQEKYATYQPGLDREKDEGVRNLIRKDVDRTMQELEFFHSEELVKAPMC